MFVRNFGFSVLVFLDSKFWYFFTTYFYRRLEKFSAASWAWMGGHPSFAIFLSLLNKVRFLSFKHLLEVWKDFFCPSDHPRRVVKFISRELWSICFLYLKKQAVGKKFTMSPMTKSIFQTCKFRLRSKNQF